jgi:hypothetical protein
MKALWVARNGSIACWACNWWWGEGLGCAPGWCRARSARGAASRVVAWIACAAVMLQIAPVGSKRRCELGGKHVVY